VRVFNDAELVLAQRVHLDVPFGQQHPVAQVDQAGPGPFPDHPAGVFFQIGQDQVRCGVRRRLALRRHDLAFLVELLAPAGLHGGQQRRQSAALSLQIGDHGLNAQRVHRLERPLFPAEAPLQRVVDVGQAARHVPGHLGGVPETVVHHAAQEVALPAFQRVQRLHALGERLPLDCLHGVHFDLALVFILESIEVQVQNDGLAPVSPGLFIEAAAGLVAQPLFVFDQCAEGLREGEVLIVRRGGPQVVGDVVDDVQAAQIGGAEGGRGGASQHRPGQLIGLCRRQAVLLDVVHGPHDAVHADAVGDEARHVVGDDHALAQHSVCEVAEIGNHLLVGSGRRNDFQQVQITRWVEEVRAHEAALKILAPAFDLKVHGNAAGVAGDDRGLFGDLLHALPQVTLGRKLLDDRFQNPVGVLQLAQVVFQVAKRD